MAIEYNKIKWENNVTKLNATNMNHIEDGIKNASDELNTKASVDYVNKTHYGYSGDDLLIIPEGTTTIADSAYQNANYKYVVIPDSVTSIGREAFYGCSGLTEITIPNSVTSIGYRAFSGCTGLTSITIPAGVTSIGKFAFEGCSGLTSITIPNSVTSIGDWAFRECINLTSITIPNGVTSIERDAFFGCSSLTSITIPNGVTSIGDWAFYGCSGLTEITIPNSVTSIGYSTFPDCPLITIDLTAYTTQSFPTIDKYNFNAIASDCQIKVIKGRKNDLIATSGWSNYASYVVEVPTVETLETALALDYYKIDKSQTTSTIPYWNGTNAGTLKAASDSVGNSVVQRDDTGSAAFHSVEVGNGTIDGISDDKGISSTVAVSQKCLSDNYLPLTGGIISGALTVDFNNNNGVNISNSGIMFSPGSGDVVYLRKSSCESLSNRAYIHQYKLIKGPNILIVQHGSDSNQLTNNPIGVHATDGQLGYLYNGTTTEPVLVKKLYDSEYHIPTAIQCLNFAEQVVTTFEYDQTTVTDIII